MLYLRICFTGAKKWRYFDCECCFISKSHIPLPWLAYKIYHECSLGLVGELVRTIEEEVHSLANSPQSHFKTAVGGLQDAVSFESSRFVDAASCDLSWRVPKEKFCWYIRRGGRFAALCFLKWKHNTQKLRIYNVNTTIVRVVYIMCYYEFCLVFLPLAISIRHPSPSLQTLGSIQRLFVEFTGYNYVVRGVLGPQDNSKSNLRMFLWSSVLFQGSFVNRLWVEDVF